jgi:lipoprotein-anchoring transpeptidase ErfK/SrfK
LHLLLRPVAGRSILVHHRKILLAMTASTALVAGLHSSAEAFPFDFGWGGPSTYHRPAGPRPVATVAREKPAAVNEKDPSAELAAKAKGVLTIVVSIDRQHLTLYSDGVPIAQTHVSTGTPGHPTPTGVFSIIQKDRWHHSNLYGDAPMYYMQRITWSGVAMHQGVVPNTPASHGCIRLPEAFAKQLWGITKLGVRVIVTHGDVTPTSFANERLFSLKREPTEPRKPEPAETLADTIDAAVKALDQARPGAAKPDGQPAEATAPRALAATPAPVVIKNDRALDAMALAMPPRQAPTTSSEVVKSAYDAFDFTGARRNKSAVAPGEARPLKPGPISVFISRKEGTLFVRKGFDPVFSVPVTFEQADQPLGTHVYTALAVNDDNTTLRWNVMTMPNGNAARRPARKGEKVELPAGPASNAGEALARVNIPPEATALISELISPGASLIISDQGLGPETGVGTDFIVLTR